jgi:hypothetical protein
MTTASANSEGVNDGFFRARLRFGFEKAGTIGACGSTLLCSWYTSPRSSAPSRSADTANPLNTSARRKYIVRLIDEFSSAKREKLCARDA